MSTSKYSIHDLSRCRGEGDANLARFNMPLELGMAMTERFKSSGNGEEHDWLLLVPNGHAYKNFISDLAGYDPTEYDGTTRGIVSATMSWLATRPDAVQTPTPQAVLNALSSFQSAREELCSAWCGRVPWSDLLMTAIRIGQESRLVGCDVLDFAPLMPLDDSGMATPRVLTAAATFVKQKAVRVAQRTRTVDADDEVHEESPGVRPTGEELKCLQRLASGEVNYGAKEMADFLSVSAQKAQYYLDRLLETGDAEHYRDVYQMIHPSRVTITAKGRDTLVKRKLL